MKVSITFAVLCLTASALTSPVEQNGNQNANAKDHFEECVKQANATEEDVAKLRNNDFENPSNNEKCLATCFFEKVGTLKDGLLQEAVVIEQLGAILGEEKTQDVLKKCRGIRAENRCETGFKIYECVEKAKA